MTFKVRRITSGKPANRTIPWKPALHWLRKIHYPFAVVMGRFKAHREKKQKHDHRVNILKRILVVLIAILCALLVIAAVTSTLVKLRIVSVHSIISVAGAELPKDAYGHTNILLLGVGDANHEGIDLTDTMMVASLDPATKSAVLLSLPRDLYLLDAHNLGKGRINSLYRDYKAQLRSTMKITEAQASQLAMQELAKEIGLLLNIKIHHVVKVDFSGFTQAVDAVGGFDIDVPEELVDPEYPATEDSYTTLVIHAGKQHFDGETALKYARSRHSTSDFDRAGRQQQILAALGDKVRGSGLFARPDRIISLIHIVQEHLETTMQLRELIGLAQMGLGIDRTNLLAMQINDQAGLYGVKAAPGGFLYAPPRDQFKGASVLLPVSIPPMPVTWKRIQTLAALLVDTRTPYLAHPSIQILNAGAPSGSSKALGAELTRYGFMVDKTENAPSRDQPTSSVVVGTKDKALGQFFADLFKMPLQLSEAPEMGGGVVTITLGKNYHYAPMQYLPPKG